MPGKAGILALIPTHNPGIGQKQGVANKPMIIICLDDPLAQQVIQRLPPGKFEVRLAQTHERGNSRAYKCADAAEGQRLLDKYEDNPGFLISDESTASAISGATLTAAASRRGWHTVLRTGSIKSGLRTMADLYLSGELRGQDNVTQMLQFIEQRMDMAGQVIRRQNLPELLQWEMEYQERLNGSNPIGGVANPEIRTKVMTMARSLVEHLNRGSFPELKPRLASEASSRLFISLAMDDMLAFINEQPSSKPVLNDDVMQAISLPPSLTHLQRLERMLKEDPRAFHEQAYEEVWRREIAGDEPPGAADSFLQRIRKKDPHFTLPEEREKRSIRAAMQHHNAIGNSSRGNNRNAPTAPMVPVGDSLHKADAPAWPEPAYPTCLTLVPDSNKTS